MKRGFTLVELLVAVLIIGVLTAMALPMYQKSVDKSRYATLMPLAKNIKDAQEAFYLGGGKYSKDLGSLDVRVPGNPSGNTATLSDGTTVEISNTDGTGYVKMGKENLNNYYVMYQDRSGSYPGEIHCEALSTNDRANELCQNLGGTKIDNALTSGYTAYVLVGTGENAGSGTLPVTKQVTSTEACTKNTDSDISNCTKYIYDDGTYTEEMRYTWDWETRRKTYSAEGAEVAEWSKNESGQGQWSMAIETKEPGAWSDYFYVTGFVTGDEQLGIMGGSSAVESAYSGNTFDSWLVNPSSDWSSYGIDYGDAMEGAYEHYAMSSTDGTWSVAQAGDSREGWNVSWYPDRTGYMSGTQGEAISASWAEAGYRSDPSVIHAWIEQERNRIQTAYCELDPANTYCQ